MKLRHIIISILLIAALSTENGYPKNFESFGGWEGDTHKVGYGYLGFGSNIISNEKIALIGRLTGSYLYYNYNKPDSIIDFKSPGVSLLSGVKITIRKSSLILLSGAEYRLNREDIYIPSSGFAERQESYKLGAVLQGFLFTPLTAKAQMMLLINYEGTNQYLFSRLTLKQIFSYKAPSVGIDGTAQGNDDLTSLQLGLFIESPPIIGNLSLKISGGYKRSWLPENLKEVGAYAGLSFYGSF